MANVITTVKAFTKTKKNKIKTAYDVKNTPAGGSNIIEPTANMIKAIGDFVSEGIFDVETIRLHNSVRDPHGKKLTRDQVKFIIKVCINAAIVDADPDLYELDEETGDLISIPQEV